MSEICFITCVNDQQQYEGCLRCIHGLTVPPGCKIGTQAVRGAGSMASGYNWAMQQSDAQYKVYLHQDVEIANQNFIEDVINLFKAQPKLGLLGVVGSKTIPESGIWWTSKELFGQVYDGANLLCFEESQLPYEEVRAIDGLIMITQYNIRWREDLFTGWHFYDTSQSLEFIKAGYEVGIPPQNHFWCTHRSVNPSTYRYNRYKRRFIKVYRKFLDV